MRTSLISIAFVLSVSLCAVAHGPSKTSGGGYSIPTTVNFCGNESVELYVLICNTTAAPAYFSAELVQSTPVFDCNIAVLPSHTRWEASILLQPGQCEPFRFTVYRPSELDQEQVVCYWIRGGEVGNLNKWLGGRLVDNGR